MKKMIAVCLALLSPSIGLCETIKAEYGLDPVETASNFGAQASAAPDLSQVGLNLPESEDLESAQDNIASPLAGEDQGEGRFPESAPSPDPSALGKANYLKTEQEAFAPAQKGGFGSAVPGETISRQARAGFDGSTQAPKLSSVVTGGESRAPRKILAARRSLAAGASTVFSAVPAFAATAANAASAPTLFVSTAKLLQAAGRSFFMAKLAAFGYGLGNGLGMVVDYPRLRAAAQSKNPDAVSTGSNAILMAASILMAARAFLNGESLLAWQNLVSGVLPMAITLLKDEKVRKLFPEGRAASDSGDGNLYSTAVTNRRLAVLIVLGSIPTVLLGALGQILLVPLGRMEISPAIPFAMQVLASGCFMYYLIPQIRKIKESNSIEGLGLGYYAGIMAICLGLGVWSLDQTLLQIRPSLGETVANLGFWTYLVYALQSFFASYFAKATIDAMKRVIARAGAKGPMLK